MRLISYGQSTAEAATYLKIAPETVKHHVKRSMRKLKVRDVRKLSLQRLAGLDELKKASSNGRTTR